MGRRPVVDTVCAQEPCSKCWDSCTQNSYAAQLAGRPLTWRSVGDTSLNECAGYTAVCALGIHSGVFKAVGHGHTHHFDECPPECKGSARLCSRTCSYWRPRQPAMGTGRRDCWHAAIRLFFLFFFFITSIIKICLRNKWQNSKIWYKCICTNIFTTAIPCTRSFKIKNHKGKKSSIRERKLYIYGKLTRM